MLGTNDARINTYRYSEDFESNYKQLIKEFQALSSNPQVYLAKPPPIFNNSLNLSGENLANGVIPRIDHVAYELSLPTIDVYAALLNHPEYFPDGVHPNNEGASLIAKVIYDNIQIVNNQR